MSNFKLILTTLAIALTASVVCFYLGRYSVHKQPLYKTVIQKPDTVFSYLRLNKTGMGQHLRENKGSPTGNKEPVICKTDLDSASNFRADIKYYPGNDMWDNSYTIPMRTIYQKEIQKIEASEGSIKPQWAFGIGAAAGYTGSNFSIRPSVSIGMAVPYKSAEFTLDLKLEPLFGSSFQLNTYINGQFKIRF